MRRGLAVIGVVAIVAAVAIAWVAWPRGTTPVDDQAARAALREELADAPAPAATEPGTLEPGAYPYRAEGDETVRLGALPEQHRVLPPELTGLVAPAGDGCFQLSLDRFQEHTESTTLCTDGEGVRLAEHRKTQSVGALSPEMVMRCEPDVLVSPDAQRVELQCHLEVSGGPMGITVDLPATATRGEPEEVRVGDGTVQAVPVLLELVASGSVEGTWSEHLWLEATTHLPVRIERALDLRGPVSFREDSTLVLESLRPQR
jgi:hypothetical protein